MKNIVFNSFAGLSLLVFLFSKTTTFAQNASPEQGPISQNRETAGEKRQNCIPQEEFERVSKQVEANAARLREEGILPPASAERMASPNPINPIFRWPLRVAPEFRGFEPYAISNYVDQNTAADAFQDYNCGSRTYDGHNGTDIYLLPHSWNLMDEGVVDIVAAAPGVVVALTDGNFDRNCSFVGNANFVILEHADGSRSWYWHMKNGSVAPLTVGEFVSEGQYLGKVGSSGWSTGPHLHFEVHHENGDVLDPYSGTCNALNTTSGWQNQKPYEEPAIVEMYTATAASTSGTCPNPDNTFRTDHFNPTGTVHFNISFRDLNNGQTAITKIYRPNGTLFATQNTAHSGGFGSWTYRYEFPFNNEATGTWRWEVTYLGKVYVKFFTIGCTGTELVSLPTSISGRKGWIAGNTVLAGTTVPLTSCTVGATSTVRFEAGVDVLLGPETWVKKGADFRATIDPCNIGGQ